MLPSFARDVSCLVDRCRWDTADVLLDDTSSWESPSRKDGRGQARYIQPLLSRTESHRFGFAR